MSRACSLLLLFMLTLAALPAVAGPLKPQTSAQASTAIPPPPPIALDPEFLGMSIRDPWYEFNTNPSFPNQPNEAFQDQMGTVLDQAGVRWVRLEFHIPYNVNVADPCNADCQWEIAKNDYFINVVAPQRNLKVLALLSFGLLRGNDPCVLNDTTSVSSRFGFGVSKYMDAWLTRALAIADRYQDHIAAYEILNEENRLAQCGTPGTFGGKAINAISPTMTGRLITKFYRFCHAIAVPADEPQHGCANARIILGGLHPRGSSAPGSSKTSLFDTQYLTAIYTDTASFATFQRDYGYYPLDGIGYHPYPEEIALSPNDVLVDRGMSRMRLALASTNDVCKQFWITEVGYNVGFDPDGPNNPRPAQTEEGQAAFMHDAYTSLARRQLDQQLCNGEREVANVFWFKYEDFPPSKIIKDSKGNPIAYPQQWGVVHIPINDDNRCEGGCYDPSGVPSQYRQSFFVYRGLRGLLGYHTYLPSITQ